MKTFPALTFSVMKMRLQVLPQVQLYLLTYLMSLVSATILKDLEMLDKMLKDGYDRRATPTNHLNNSQPTVVECELYIRNFGSPDPMTMDYKVDLYIRQSWMDERLRHPDLKKPLDLNDPNLVKAIWKPEVYFPNGKEADFQYVTVPNVLIRINPDGHILYMLRLRVTFSCNMELSKFPLDSQVCTMEVASFSKTVEELILEWKERDPVTAPKFGMSQFALVDTLAEKCEADFQIGNYSCLIAKFYLSRSLGFHLVQSYLPTILMVVISWVSFWMDVNSVPGRVTLGVTTLLTVSSKATNIQENLPQCSYVKAIDVWMGTCTAFVFLALLEFTVVNYLWRKECCKNFRRNFQPFPSFENFTGSNCNLNHNATTKQEIHGSNPKVNHALEARFIGGTAHHRLTSLTGSEGHPIIPLPVEGVNIMEPQNPRASISFQARARHIDETCRFAFPLAFAVFNTVYWPYYLLT